MRSVKPEALRTAGQGWQPVVKADLPFANRKQAGSLLGDLIRNELPSPHEALILGLVRGGAVVAAAASDVAQIDWDILIVRKIGAPRQPEYAVGAYAESGTYILNEPELQHLGVSHAWRDNALRRAAQECASLNKELRCGSAAPRLSGRCVVLTDDGLATGLTMLTAIEAAKRTGASRVYVAIPVIAPTGRTVLSAAEVNVIFLACPPEFQAVGQFYKDFHPITSDEVRGLLATRQ